MGVCRLCGCKASPELNDEYCKRHPQIREQFAKEKEQQKSQQRLMAEQQKRREREQLILDTMRAMPPVVVIQGPVVVNQGPVFVNCKIRGDRDREWLNEYKGIPAQKQITARRQQQSQKRTREQRLALVEKRRRI